jgi:predicted RNA polymerase sigma factor
VPLREQDRTRWDAARIARGTALVSEGLAGGVAGPYLVQAAIAALHATAPTYGATDWAGIIAWYDRLIDVRDDPVLRLNRAVARMEHGAPAAALVDLDDLADRLARFSHFHASRAEVLDRLGRRDAAASALRTAIDLTDNAPLRNELTRRLAAWSTGTPQ